jgi:hypothetical protein
MTAFVDDVEPYVTRVTCESDAVRATREVGCYSREWHAVQCGKRSQIDLA